jgi:hypothetical protein
LELRIWDTAANPNVRRTKTQTPSPASRPKGTRARGWCRARRRRRKLPPLSGTFLLVPPTQFLLFLEIGLCICD